MIICHAATSIQIGLIASDDVEFELDCEFDHDAKQSANRESICFKV